MNAIVQVSDFLTSSGSTEPVPLPLDGERFVPDEMHGNIELEHRHRYVFASQFVSGKTVLDIASGEGYGSALLAKTARHVIGVDISELAVEHARQRYHADNLEFVTGSCAAIPLADAAVDVVVSFETIEHHAEHEAMMREIARVLRPGGLLVISSPDKVEYSDKPSFRNPFHVKELYKEEFQELLSKHFRHVKLFGQRVVLGSVILGEPQSEGIRQQRPEQRGPQNPVDLEPLYWVALASEDSLPPAPDSIYNRPAATPDETAHQQRDSVLTRVIRALAVPHSERLRSCLQSKWYLERNADLVAAKVDPYEHWITTGAQEGRLPASDCLSLAEELLQEQLLQSGGQLKSQLGQSAGREQQLRQEVQDLSKQLQHSQIRADAILEQCRREALERLLQERRESQERLELAQKELFEQRASLQAEIARAQLEASKKIESQLRELAQRDKALTDQLQRQQEILETQRVQLTDAADRRLTALAAESSERERLLRHDVQSLRERLEEVQRQALQTLERADREATAQLASHLTSSMQREQAFAAQLLQQQEKFDSERVALSESTQKRLSSQAAQHTERELQLQQDAHNLQERLERIQRENREQMEAQLRQSVDREQAFAARLLQERERWDELIAAERSQLYAQYSTVLLSLKRNLDELQSSMSWRLAAPIRAMAAAFGAKVSLPRTEELESLIQLPRYRRD